MQSHKERRAQPRRKDRVALVFSYSQQQCSVNTMDVSTTGALIRTPVAFPSGTLLVLEAPSLCQEDGNVRILAKVVRASQHRGDPGSVYSGLGLMWIRAFSGRGVDHLRTFLADVLGFSEADTMLIGSTSTGDAVYDFNGPPEPPPGPLRRTTQAERLEEYRERREEFASHLEGHFRLNAPVVYSVSNMHYRGSLIAVGTKRLAVLVRGALPFQGAKVSVRYPLDLTPTAPRIIMHAQTEAVLEPFMQEGGMFLARIDDVDEMGNRGLYRAHLKNLRNNSTKTW